MSKDNSLRTMNKIVSQKSALSGVNNADEGPDEIIVNNQFNEFTMAVNKKL